MNTNWSSPKTNIIAALLDLRSALQSGHPAVLRRVRNEDCSHPIRVRLYDTDFRNYEFSIGYLATRQSINDDQNLGQFEKYLALNYKNCYGTPEAVETYYKTGVVSADNFKGVGRSHLVNVKDMVEFLNKTGDTTTALMFSKQYISLEEANQRHFYDFYRYNGSKWAIKKFKNKLWVVELLSKDTIVKVPLAVKILNVVLAPLKYMPKKSVLKMPEYKLVTFRVGGIYHGYSVEFHIPKKFGFK